MPREQGSAWPGCSRASSYMWRWSRLTAMTSPSVCSGVCHWVAWRPKLSLAVVTGSDGLQTVAFSVRAGHLEYETEAGVCKTVANALGFDSLPANEPRFVRLWRRFAVDNYLVSIAWPRQCSR